MMVKGMTSLDMIDVIYMTSKKYIDLQHDL